MSDAVLCYKIYYLSLETRVVNRSEIKETVTMAKLFNKQ